DQSDLRRLPGAEFLAGQVVAGGGPRRQFRQQRQRDDRRGDADPGLGQCEGTARAAARYYLTGEKFGAGQAAEIGLITLAAEDVGAAVDELVSDIARGSPQGLAASKALTTAAVLERFDRDAERLAEESARLFVSDEAREGMLAFLEKRAPNWTS
ncbi:enoyl-CoA hydratase-related protein, partial [Mycobacterium sp. 1465703.0]|uniref:enoyl-CoA hydratase-related protein n=1 Tax=Mycobacterium sp. 1465703.0 TaxID=1834078 RepID=UPI000A487D01